MNRKSYYYCYYYLLFLFISFFFYFFIDDRFSARRLSRCQGDSARLGLRLNPAKSSKAFIKYTDDGAPSFTIRAIRVRYPLAKGTFGFAVQRPLTRSRDPLSRNPAHDISRSIIIERNAAGTLHRYYPLPRFLPTMRSA